MISLIIPADTGRVLTVSENGYGKRTELQEFPTKGRGGMGVIAMSTSERNGRLVGAVQVFEGDQLMLISNQGTLVRTRADEVSLLGRNTQGVRVIRTKKDESLVSVERIAEPDEEPVFEGEGEDEGVNASQDETAIGTQGKIEGDAAGDNGDDAGSEE